MITNGVLAIIDVVLGFIVGLLPAYTGLPTELHDAIVWMLTVVGTTISFLPVHTIWTVFLLIMTVEIALSLLKFFAWVFHWKQS